MHETLARNDSLDPNAIEDVVLGWVDAWVGDTGGGSTSNSLPGYIRLNRGSNNPVKFHAGFGTICGIEGLVDCAFGILGSTSNQSPGITTPEGKANVIVCQEGDDGFCVEEVLNNGQGVPFLAYRDESRLNDFGFCIPDLTLPQYAAVSSATVAATTPANTATVTSAWIRRWVPSSARNSASVMPRELVASR